jgi:hypothetical protein
MNSTYGDISYEPQPLPFNTIAGKKTRNRNLHTKKTSSSGHTSSRGIDKLLSTFGGTIINEIHEDLIPFNVT